MLGTAGTDIGISSAGSAHTFDIPTASATKRGALSSADWSTFNSKMSNSLTSANIWVGNSGNAATAVSMSGDATMSNAGVVTLATSGVTAGSYAKVSVDAKGRVIAGLSMTSSDITTALGFTPAGAATAFVQNGNIFGASAVLGTNDANSLEFETNNSTKMTILSGGNVGIGTTTPGSKLEVAGNITGYNSGVAVDALIEAKHFSANAGNSGAIQFLRARGTSAAPTQPQSGDQLGAIRAQNAVNPNSWPGIYFNTTENHSASAQGSAISFQTTANGTVGGTERVRIDQNGNVGIGTTSPAEQLTLADSGKIRLNKNSDYTNLSSGDYGLWIETSQIAGGKLRIGESWGEMGISMWDSPTPYEILIGGGAGKGVGISGNNTDPMANNGLYVASSNNVGIGTTTPGQKLTVAGTIESTSGGIKLPDATTLKKYWRTPYC
ncbi:MAG: hypothetical protein IPM97_01015 [Bdellovibrionaceae bacterium]|nr:hypothetical protein [Pseudobdellovibrionaceae bacterium]